MHKILQCISLMLLLSTSNSLFGQVTMAEVYGDGRQVMGLSNADNRNINHADGTLFQNQKRAVVGLMIPNNDPDRPWRRCTGFLVNTVTQNGRRYLVTANHCIEGATGDAFNIYLTLNYEMAGTARGLDASDMDITRVFDVPVIVRLSDRNHDIALLEVEPGGDADVLFGVNGPFFNAYASGWSISPYEKIWANLSHPLLDHKKVFIDPAEVGISPQVKLDGRPLSAGTYFRTKSPWNGVDTSPQQGSSGSSLMNQEGISFAVAVSANIPRLNFSALSNSWQLIAPRDGEGLQLFLDPEGTWLSKIPGGYLNNLIPNNGSSNTLIIDPGEELHTPLPDWSLTDPYQHMKFIHPSFLYDDLGQAPLLERTLGIKLVGTPNARVYLTMHAVGPNSNAETLIYGAYAEVSSPVTQSDFQQSGWPRLSPPAGIAPSMTLVNASSTDFKNALVRHTIRDAQVLNQINYIFKHEIPIVVRLRHLGEGGPVEVQAVSYPGDTPKNALELFKPEELSGRFQYTKYPESKGTSSNALYINQLLVENIGEIKEISTGNNGGFLNLVNPNFLIENVTTSYWADGNQVEPILDFDINVHNTSGSDFYYKIWMDYYATEEDGFYVFDETGTDGMASELIAEGSASDQISEEYVLPDYLTLGMNTGDRKKVRMRVAISNEDNVQPDGIYVSGEVEDYLIELVAPTCETTRPVDYETYAEGILTYCGDGGYREVKDQLSGSFQQAAPRGLTFKTGKESNIPFASAKAVSSWYTNGFDAISDTRVSPIPDPSDPSFDQSLIAISTNTQESDPDQLIDQDLKMDVYYPLPKDGTTLDELPALPVIIYHFGGAFMWNTRQSRLTEKTCEWLASRGYIVAAIDYRVGLYGYEEEVAKRTLIRAWQDSRAATKWWRMPQNEYQVTEEFQVLWKADQSRVFALGHSAGGITSQANLHLTEAIFGDEIVSGDFLAGAIDGYGYGGLDDSGNPHYRTFSLLDYEPIPCLEIMGVNTCDELSQRTDGTYGTYQGSDSQLSTQISQLLQEYASKDGRVDEAISFAGALAKTDWMFIAPHRPSAEIHHRDDAVVPWGHDFPFNGGSLPWGSIAGLFPSFSLARIYGGGAMEEAWEEATDRGIFELKTLTETNEAGMSGEASYHVPQYKFNSSYDDYLAGGEPELEDQIMYYVDAFFTKDWGGSSARVTIDEQPESMDTPIEEESIFKVFPNPASEEVNVIVDMPEPGSLEIRIVDFQGRVVYERKLEGVRSGTQWIRLYPQLASGGYIIEVRTKESLEQEKLLIHH